MDKRKTGDFFCKPGHVPLFPRVEGKEAPKKEEVSQFVHAERLVEIEGLSEFGLLTEAMTEEEFQKKRERISGIIRVIRAE